jgi:hypothetical protein
VKKLDTQLLLAIGTIIATHSVGFAANAAPQSNQSDIALTTPQIKVAVESDQIKLVVETPRETKETQKQEVKSTVLTILTIHTIDDIPDIVASLTQKLLAQPLRTEQSHKTQMEYTYKKLPIEHWFDAEIYRRLALIVASRYISTDVIYDKATGKVIDRSIYYFPDNDEKNFTKEFSQKCKVVVDQLKSNWTECTIGKKPNPRWHLWKKEGEVNSAMLINALLAKFGQHKKAFAHWDWDPQTMSGTLYLWIKKTHVSAFNKKFLTQFSENDV